MPPSGYNSQQANALETFLRSCAGALQAEAGELQLSPVAGLDNELLSIARHLREAKVSATQRATLVLTEAFYQRLRAAQPADSAAFGTAVDSALAEMRGEILDIKVSPIIAA